MIRINFNFNFWEKTGFETEATIHMVKVCDSIMGSGKSSAAITYINEHPNERFLYLAPYLAEADRIKNACKGAKFVAPAVGSSTNGYSKTAHTYDLLLGGHNVASTHQALNYYTKDMLAVIGDMEYIVIIDEAVNILDCVNPKKRESGKFVSYNVSCKDLDSLIQLGYLREEKPNEYHLVPDMDIEGFAYTPILRKAKSRPLVKLCDEITPDGMMWRWLFQKEIFEYAKDVYILTYLFDGSELQQFIKMCGFGYEYIWIVHDDNDVYRFTGNKEKRYIPDYARRLDKMIAVCNIESLNEIGEDRCALSENWFKQHKNRDQWEPDIDRLRKNERTFFEKHAGGALKDGRMIGVYSDNWDQVKVPGCGNQERNAVIFNMRAQNRWGTYTSLSYPVNLFMNPKVKKYFNSHGANINDDQYALSTMVQWIWRSAIRNGEKIYVYVPSRRMRELLYGWIEKVKREVRAV